MDSSLKISRAVTKTAFSKPFWGSLMLSLPIQEKEDIGTACTDGQHIWWNSEFISSCTELETEGTLAHEIGHIIFDHCQDWSPKDPKLCNISMDYVINGILIEDGMHLPKGTIEPNRLFTNMTWQQVYAILEDVKKKHEDKENGNTPDYNKGPASNEGMSQQEQEELGQKVSDMMNDPSIEDIINNPNLSDSEREELRQDIERKVIQAAQNAKAQGVGTLPGGLEGLINEIRRSNVDWKELIRANLKSNFPENYTMNKPNKKFLGSYNIYMPTMEGKKIGTLAVGLDSSGSMNEEDHIRILSELNAISQEMKVEKIMIFYTDAEVARVEEYNEGEEITELKIKGYGGTSFVPVFDYIYENGIEVDQLIYMSDMEVWDNCFPTFEPDYPVLWLSTRDDYKVPFGDLIQVRN